MMGERRVRQDALFYEFSLERHVPERHLLRSIDRFVELDGLRQHLRPFYSEMGRPSIDPELMIRMLIVGYCFGIRGSVWRGTCQTIPPSRRTGMGVFARAISCASFSRPRSDAASRKGSSAKALPLMPA